MIDRNYDSIDTQVRENLEALGRLCQYVAREAVILQVPEAEQLGNAVSDRIQKLLKVLADGPHVSAWPHGRKGDIRSAE